MKKLKTYGQEQVLDRYNFLDDNKKQKLIKQIKNIDFDQIQELFIEKDKKIDDKACKITNIEYVDKSKLSKETYVVDLSFSIFSNFYNNPVYSRL